jgi:hypothetical protein
LIRRGMGKMHAPVFIVGTGRSGTTIFFRMFTGHSQVAWLSGLLERLPRALALNRAYLRLLDLPGLGPQLRQRISPAEVYRLWNLIYPQFARPGHDLRAAQVTAAARRGFRQIAEASCTGQRSRFLAKFTGWPRIGFLQEVFPEARFIHILRDGRAVASSFLGVDWWLGRKGPDHWRWGPLSPKYQALWEEHNKSHAALAAIQWLILMDAFDRAVGEATPGSVLTVRYGDLCRDPLGVFQKVCGFCNIVWDPDFERSLKGYHMSSADSKWRKNLSGPDRETLNRLLAQRVDKLGLDTGES